MKRVTIKDVAEAAGVSYSTVSRALAGNPGISQHTHDRIMQLCREMNYTPNAVARSMVVKSTKLLGLILPGVNNPYMSELAYQIDREARKRGYSIILCNSNRNLDSERELFGMLIGHQVDGIVLFPSSTDSYKSLEFLLTQVPVVFMGENMQDAPESYVSVDNYRGAYMGTEYLYELGHRDIVYLGCRRGSTSHKLRKDGYAAACKDLGLKPQYCNNPFSSSSIKYGEQLAKQLFAERRDFTAIFASTDTNALGVIKAAEECGIRIPEDVSLLGFDNIRDANLPRIELTTVDQNVKMLASVSITVLLDKIETDLEGYTHRILVPTICERKSCIRRAVDQA